MEPYAAFCKSQQIIVSAVILMPALALCPVLQLCFGHAILIRLTALHGVDRPDEFNESTKTGVRPLSYSIYSSKRYFPAQTVS